MISAKDFSVAFSSLGKTKGYVITIALTLGLTLGALVAMFNLNYQLLATSLPYPDQDRLFVMQCNVFKNGQPEFLGVPNASPYPLLVEGYKNNSDYFEKKALVNFYVDVIRSLPDTPQVNTSYITPEYLQILQPPMSLGRVFSADEGLNTRSPVAVISYDTWLKVFNKDPDILSKTLRFGEVEFKIIGVTSAEFSEPQIVEVGRATQVWLPWDYNLVPENFRSWGGFIDHEYVIGKLKPGVERAVVEHELTSLLNTRFKEENASIPFFDTFSLGLELFSYQRVILGDSKKRALMLFAGALALLLIAATNITNLVLARSASQQRNMAIQAALGAQKFHLFNAVFAEILILMGIAAILSLFVSFGGIELLKTVAKDQFPRLSELRLSWQSIAFALISAVALAALFALMVSRQINYRALHNMLQSSGKGVGIQISGRVRQALILLQVALAGFLLAVNLQILQQSLHHINQPLGLAVNDIYEVELNIGLQRGSPNEERKRNLIAIRDELRANPKIANASLTHFFPIGQNSAGVDSAVLSAEADLKDQKRALLTFIDESYLDIFDIKLAAGRYITVAEFQEDIHSIVINETFARNLQADGKVLNKRFYIISGESYEVVGIVRDLSLPGVPEESRIFVPQTNVEFPRLLLKLKPNQQLTKEELNLIMAKVNSQYKVAVFLSMVKAQDMLLAKDTLSAWLTAALALLTLCLAGIGIYGVLSYTVLLRRFELGIRMAIGARPITIFMQILTDNLIPVLLGVMIALASLFILWLWIQGGAYYISTSFIAWSFPILIILLLTAIASLLSVWQIINKPAICALHND